MITKLITRSNNKNKTNMNAEIKTIYPHQAKQLLKLNTRNRPLASRHVNLLADEMRAGNWKLNGETITVSEDTLLDGQHRLAACVLANTPFKSFVVEGADNECFDTIDVGKKRSNSDALVIRGEKHATKLAAALRLIDGYYSKNALAEVGGQVSNIRIQQLLAMHPDIRKSVQRYGANPAKSLVPMSHVCAYHYIFAQIDPHLASVFMDKLLSGLNLTENDPINVLRTKLINIKITKNNINNRVLRAYLIKAWNALRDGRKIKILTWRSAKNPNEPFPRAK